MKKLTSTGVRLYTPPPYINDLMNSVYNLLLKDKPIKEQFENGSINEIFSIGTYPQLGSFLLEYFKPIHETWCGQSLIPAQIYGVRSYLNGSYLDLHVDTNSTHHVSSIWTFEYDLNGEEEWPLQIYDHENIELNLFLRPNTVLFYESSICRHGRPTPFKGKFYRNLYMHYTVNNVK